MPSVGRERLLFRVELSLKVEQPSMGIFRPLVCVVVARRSLGEFHQSVPLAVDDDCIAGGEFVLGGRRTDVGAVCPANSEDRDAFRRTEFEVRDAFVREPRIRL